MDARLEYQYTILRMVVREVAARELTPAAAHQEVSWRLRALSQHMSHARQYTQAFWVRELAGQVQRAASVNVVWCLLREARKGQPPTSNRGVNSDVKSIKGLSDG